MTPRNVYRIQPRDSMYTHGELPFSAKAANDEPADEPKSWLESAWFLVPMLIAAGAVLLARSQGWLP